MNKPLYVEGTPTVFGAVGGWLVETSTGGPPSPHLASACGCGATVHADTSGFATAADTLALVEAVDNPYLRMNLDLYHAQIGEGNLIQLVERALPVVGEIQVADVPGRCEPGTGEIRYPAVAAALNRLGYDGVVALEAFASGDSLLALDRFRSAFKD